MTALRSYFNHVGVLLPRRSRAGRGADHDPEAKTGAREDGVCGNTETEMLVDRHVPRGEGKQMAGNTLLINSRCHLLHECAADSLPLMVWLDTEPIEMPMWLLSWQVSQVGGELLETS